MNMFRELLEAAIKCMMFLRNYKFWSSERNSGNEVSHAGSDYLIKEGIILGK